MENGENKKLQGRREFFKEVARKTLPIVGAVVFLSNPIVAKAVENEPLGCQYGCAGTCYGNCVGTCYTGCYAQCYTTCLTTCQDTCKGGCYISCSGTCRGSEYFG